MDGGLIKSYLVVLCVAGGGHMHAGDTGQFMSQGMMDGPSPGEGQQALQLHPPHTADHPFASPLSRKPFPSQMLVGAAGRGAMSDNW